MRVCAVIPAAGRGTRLGGDLPKFLVPVDGERTLWQVLHHALAPHVDHIHAVVSSAGREWFEEHRAEQSAFSAVTVSVQEQPTGMGDAVFGCSDVWSSYDAILVVWGDQANISATTVGRLLARHEQLSRPACTIALARQEEPYVEYVYSDGDPEQLTAVRQSREGDHCTPGGLADVGVFCLSTEGLLDAWRYYRAEAVAGGLTGEANLLPFFPALADAGWECSKVIVRDPAEARGINTPEDLAFTRERLSRIRRAGSVRRLAMVCSEMPPGVVGGLGRYAERLLGAMEDWPVETDVFTMAGPGATSRRDRSGRVTIHRLAGLIARKHRGRATAMQRIGLVVDYLAFNARAVARLATFPRGTVVAVHDWMGAPAGLITGAMGRSVTFHVHSTEMSVDRPWFRRGPVTWGVLLLEAAMARRADRIIVPSARMADDLADRGWPRDHIQVIAHGAADPLIGQLLSRSIEEREELARRVRSGYGDPPTMLVYAGRLSDLKGVSTLLRAMSKVVPRVPGCVLVLAGEGTPHTEEDERAAALAETMPDHVHVLHRFLPAEDLFAHFLAADVCVFPSTYEPFGFVAMEALSLGKPVVVGAGYDRAIADSPGVRQCDRDDPQELARVLTAALLDEDWLQEAGPAGRIWAESRFDWGKTCEETLAAYAEAAES